jgi:hypothetical protein
VGAYDDEVGVTLFSGTSLAEEKRQRHIGLHVQHRQSDDDVSTATITAESETLGNTAAQADA